MNCHNCKNSFDESTYVPRLLIVCGHSFCDTCLSKIHSNGKIICPECRTTNFVQCIASLPRNLALLNSKQHEISMQCSKHNKKFQAFCNKQKMLLCVNCILQDVHRNHHQMIQPIANAYGKEKERMNKQNNLTEKMYTRIQDQLNKLEDAYQLGLKCFQQNQQAIQKYFSEVRKIVQMQEDVIRQKSQDLFTNFQIKNKQRQSAFIANLEVLDDYSAEVSKSNLYTPQQFLERSKIRENLTSHMNQNIDSVASFTGLTINKNTIMDCLIKAFEKSKTKQLKESNTKQIIKADLSKAKGVIPQKMKKPCLAQQNSKIKYAPPKKYSKKQPLKQKQKQPMKQAVKETSVPMLVKRPQTTIQKSIPIQISGFDESHTLFKSFLSSNASFFLERRYVYVFGGFCEQSNSVIRLNLDTMKWDYISPMVNRSKFGLAQLSNKDIVMLGGKRDKLRILTGQAFRDNSLVSGVKLNNVRSGFGTVVLNDQLHVIGGNDGQEILTTFQRYCEYESNWKKLEPLNQGRDELAVTIGRDSKIYAIGGFGGIQNSCLRSVQRYDPVTHRWEFARSMIIPRRALSAVTLADGIYAIGGFDGQNYLSSVQKFDQYSNTWTMIADMKQARCTHSGIAVFETQQIFVFGGFDLSPLSSVQKYSVITGKWQIVSEMPVPRFMHGCLYVKQ